MAPIYPSGSIEQFRLDLLRCTLAADMERFYETAIDDICHNQYGVIPQTNNLMDQLFIKHSHHAAPIIPDRSHITELIDDTQTLTRELTDHINNAHAIIDTMKRMTKWTHNLYPNGTKPQRFSARTAFNMKHYITDIEQTHQGDCMSPCRYYATTSNRCIHCKGTHASEDHHLSVSIPSLPNTGHTVLLLPQEQNNPSEPNTDALNEYKTMRKLLPSQQSAYLASQWTPHPRQNSLPHRVLQHTDSTLCIADTSDRPVLFLLPIYRFTLR